MMPKTYLQTVEIKMPNAPFKVFGLEFCPVAPTGVRALKESDGSTIIWFDDKTVKWSYDRTILTWRRRPVEEDAMRTLGKGEYYEFKTDGTVFAKKNGFPYFWSVPMEGTYTEGVTLDVHICSSAGGEYFLRGEKCLCPTCYGCGVRMDDDGMFCSRSCMVSGVPYFD